MPGDLVRRNVPLDPIDADTRTETGIFLSEPDPDKGHPIVVAQTDVTGLVYNIVGPEDADLAVVAEAIAAAQRDLEMGDWFSLWVREPQYGYTYALTPFGIRHIVSVTRGFAALVDARTTQRPQLLTGKAGPHFLR